MKKFIVYSPTGEILRTGICPDRMVKLQAHGNEYILEGATNDIENIIIGGKVVRKTEEEIAAVKEKMKHKPDAQEVLIQKKEREILRRMAIEELEKEI
jgi:hypothetical protein